MSDQDYFKRHVGGATPLEIPQNLLGIDTIPVIFGVGTKTELVSSNQSVTKNSTSTKKVQFDDPASANNNHPHNGNSNSGRKSSSKKKSLSNLDQHYRKRSRSRSKYANRKKKLNDNLRKSSAVSDEERFRSSDVAGMSG